jgi:hypothetical protein
MPASRTDRKPAAYLAAVALAVALALGVSACTSDDVSGRYSFGPFDIAANQEVVGACVQISLHNSEALYVQSVELTTGPGFHHSNWLFVPDTEFAGNDGTFPCADRGYNEEMAAALGGVLFAQSTQLPHETQAFPAGVAIRIPPQSKIMAQIHLLNAQDAALHLTPTIQLTTIARSEVKTLLSAIAFEDQALALPSHKQSRFSIECDLAPLYNQRFQHDPDFKVYYALAHYHTLGIGLQLEAIKPDGTAATVFSTAHQVGDTLGGPVAPSFDMTGYTRLRLTCDFVNPRDTVVGWGVGDQEMCVFLAFSDSKANWGGAAVTTDPGTPTTGTDGVVSYSQRCAVLALPADN